MGKNTTKHKAKTPERLRPIPPKINFSEVDSQAYAETLTALFNLPAFKELEDKRNSIVDALSRCNNVAMYNSLYDSMSTKTNAMAAFIARALADTYINHTDHLERTSLSDLFRYHVDYEREGIKEKANTLNRNLMKLIFLADLTETLCMDIRSQMKDVFNGYADHTSFNGVSAALSQLRGYLQASRTCFKEKEYSDLYSDYSDSVNAYLDKRLNTFTRKVASKMPSVHGYTEQELLDALNQFFDTDRKFGRRFIQRNEQGGRFINVPLLAMELNDAQTAKIDKYVRYDRRDNDAVSEYCYRVTDIIMREYKPSD